MIRSLVAALVVFTVVSDIAWSQDTKSQEKGRGGRAGMRGMMMGRGGEGGETAQQQVGKPIPPQEELIKKLEQTLSNATLSGVYTTDRADTDRPPREDKYTLGKVSKLPEADLWTFEAKLSYGGSNLTVPITVAVKWAGDTPMIQLTNTTIPGMGTYSARVFLYEGRYAGTWQHGPAGGIMYGRIVKEEKPAGQ